MYEAHVLHVQCGIESFYYVIYRRCGNYMNATVTSCGKMMFGVLILEFVTKNKIMGREN